MGHKKVCLSCRESFNLDPSDMHVQAYPCAKCGKWMSVLPHQFRPPRKTDEKGWKLVEFLVNNGFPFHHIEPKETLNHSREKFIPYPSNLRDAKVFIEKHKDKAINK